VKSIVLIIKGMIVGIANVVPGLSTGTFLVMLGIYDRLLEAVSGFLSDRKRIKSHLLFLIPLGIGTVGGTLVFAELATFVLDRYPTPTQLFLIGLIAGSIPGVIKMHHDMKPATGRVIAFVAGLAVAILVGLQGGHEVGEGASADISSLSDMIYFGVVGLFAGAAVITPGMSGSYIFLLGGTYEPIMQALHSLTSPPIMWGVIISTAVGVGVGFLAFSKLISLLLKRYPAVTFYAILGLICGSFVGLWPAGVGLSVSSLLGILALVVGAVIAYVLGMQAGHGEPDPE
jgi:putative membrane protein